MHIIYSHNAIILRIPCYRLQSKFFLQLNQTLHMKLNSLTVKAHVV